ncbi:NADAR family protein [Paenibacillus sp. HWE-109]|uniref:NADAR family protein n=1 Tax=Paenibacillus sp. HWE-109 TaxID=1306526 RepID=UPI001EE0CFEB|nr:NADAR family protein [Paenibacillus sp. HWE-109]UKS26722.1 NADAR family protein [Paenibacillus sp. HWE-109]
MEKFTFFWRTQSPFSQWHSCRFIIDGNVFNCAEQYMMYMKASIFEDAEIAGKILASRSPSDQKKLGRNVKNFKADQWQQVCKKIVYDANYAKFTQNPELKHALLATGGTTLVEASPDDKIWGIGLAEEHPHAQNRRTWRGTNWLGDILTTLREDLIKEK